MLNVKSMPIQNLSSRIMQPVHLHIHTIDWICLLVCDFLCVFGGGVVEMSMGHITMLKTEDNSTTLILDSWALSS